MFWGRRGSDGVNVDLRPYIVGWVTPNASKINEVISVAKNRLPDKSFHEYQAGTGLIITSVTIHKFPALKPNGSAWDAFGGNPDLNYMLVNGTTLAVVYNSGNIYQDATNGLMPMASMKSLVCQRTIIGDWYY